MENPKLALIPSGYKSGKVYSILPNDATGDFDFTRQSIGTRVRKDGLIEEAKTLGSITNLQPRSEEFNDSVWSKTRSSISANQELAPDGTNTADKFIGTGTGASYILDGLPFTNGKKYTISVYVKAINVTTFLIYKFSGGTGTADFNLSTGTINSVSGTMSNPIIESLSNGWFRCSTEHIPSGTGTQNYGFGLQNYNGDQYYIWGAMVSEGALSDYIKTEGSSETKTVETFTDVPRLDWYNSNCPSLLLEPQRTNYAINSSDASLWSNVGGSQSITKTQNFSVSPTGERNATRLEANATGLNYSLIQLSTTFITGNYTGSVYLKSNTQNIQNIIVYGRNTAVNSYEIGNEWRRIDLQGSGTTGQNLFLFIGSYPSNGSDEIIDISVWGGQLELGDFASSYIPTTNVIATRLKDVCGNAGDSQLLNNPENTFFIDLNKIYKTSTSDSRISLNDGSATNRVLFSTQTNNITIILYSIRNNVTTTVKYFSVDYDARNKIAYTLKANEIKFYVNGAKIHEALFFPIPLNLSNISFDENNGGSRVFQGEVNEVRYYDRVLTEAEAIKLTTI